MSVAVEHQHAWRGVFHLDGCHWYQNAYRCTCGATLSISGERQFYYRKKIQAGVMHSDEDCERCSALLSGARRRPTRRVLDEPPKETP